MQIDFEKHIAPLQAKGKTAVEIAAVLTTLRKSPTFVADVESRIVPWGLLKRTPQGTVYGPLSDAASAAEDSPLKRTAELFFSWLGSSRAQTIRTHEVDIAPIWSGGMSVLVTASLLTQEQAGELMNLSGGAQYPGIVQADIEQAIVAHAQQQAQQAALNAERDAEAAAGVARAEVMEVWQPIFNTHIAAVLNGTPTLPALLAAVEAAHNALSDIVQG